MRSRRTMLCNEHRKADTVSASHACFARSLLGNLLAAAGAEQSADDDRAYRGWMDLETRGEYAYTSDPSACHPLDRSATLLLTHGALANHQRLVYTAPRSQIVASRCSPQRGTRTSTGKVHNAVGITPRTQQHTSSAHRLSASGTQNLDAARWKECRHMRKRCSQKANKQQPTDGLENIPPQPTFHIDVSHHTQSTSLAN